MSKIIDLEFNNEDIEDIEEKEIFKNHSAEKKKEKKITYERIKDKDGQFIKGIRKKLVNGKLWGYEATFCYGYEDVYDEKKRSMVHKQITERKSFTNLKHAKKWYSDLVKKKLELEEVDKQIEKHGYTLLEVCDLYYQYRVKNGDGKGYLTQLRIQKDHFATFFNSEDNKYVKKIDTQTIQDYLDYEKNRGYCKQSIDKYKSHLNLMWEFMLVGEEKFQVRKNVVMPAINHAPDSEFESVALTYFEMEEWLSELVQLEDPTYLFEFVFAFSIGLRRGELAGLLWKDINWDTKQIKICHNRVQRTKKDADGVDDVDERGLKLPKRDKVRTVEMHKLALDTLILYKEWQENILGHEVDPEDFVLKYEINLLQNYIPHVGKISRKWGELYTALNKSRAKRRLTELVKARLHDGRETYATLLLHGVKKLDDTIIYAANNYQVYESMGHSFTVEQPNTTEKIYNKPTADRWDITRFWDELIDFDVAQAWDNYQQIRQFDYEAMTEFQRIKKAEQKRKKYEKAKRERLAGNPPEEEFIEYIADEK